LRIDDKRLTGVSFRLCSGEGLLISIGSGEVFSFAEASRFSAPKLSTRQNHSWDL